MDARRRFSRRTAIKAAGALAATGIARGADAQIATSSTGKPKTRECIWIPTTDGQFCCGMIHRPAEIRDKVPAALILHDRVGSKDQPHRLLVSLADALAAAGHIAMRFDLRGRGDSEGESIDATPQRDLTDTRAALAMLRNEPGVDTTNISAIGFGYGGTILAELCGESIAIKRIALWSCCPTDNENFKPIMEDHNGREVSDQLGSLLSSDFFEGVAALTPASALKKNRQPVFMVYGTRDANTRQDAYETARSELAFADVDAKSLIIQNADHDFSTNAASQEAIEKTIAWIREKA